MPPKAKKAAASVPPAGGVPLDGCVIVFSGRFTGYKQSALESKVANLGGQPAKSVVADTTHVVTTQADYDNECTKVWQAKDRGGIFIVNLDWLLESEQSSSRQAEAQYLFDASQNGTTNGNNASAPSSTQPTSTQPAPAPVQNNPSSKKRQASATPEPKTKKTKLDEVAQNGKAAVIGKEQIAKSWDVQVPVDEGCPLTGYGVHIDEDSVIWDASLNQTNAGHNNNKFYRIQVLVSAGDAKTWTRWGRVGERGMSKILGMGGLQDAKTQFKKKFKEKTGLTWESRMDEPKLNKYVFFEKSYQSDSDSEEDVKPAGGNEQPKKGPPPCTLKPAVQDLMKLIFNERYFAAAMTDMNYDLDKLPLGKLSKATIMRGFQALKDLSLLMDDPVAATAAGNTMSVEDLSNRYYSLIPHNFGRNRPPIINNQVTVKREIELLETLADMKDASNILKAEIAERENVHPLDRQFRGLGLEEMTELDQNGTEFNLLKDYLVNTRGQTHYAVNYRNVENIFRIERKGEKDRFISDDISDRRLLWHGSRTTNFGGILSQGLRIAPPEAPATGYMFDKGIYLADMSSKSANYCYSYISDNTALLLLCEAELGKPMQEFTDFQYDAAALAKQKGVWSTFGMGSTGPQEWKDAECVHPSLKGIKMPDTSKKMPGPTGVIDGGLIYNEYIAYDISQVRLRYLFRVKM